MILSVAIITEQGTPLVSRQFTNISKTQITNHLSVFPKLLTENSQSYVESSTIRFVYQKIEQLYFILITTKDSNILEDLSLLNLLIELTREIISQITEQNVLEHALNLILAYDECVFDGYRQSVSVNDVINFLLMESKEEDEYNADLNRKMDRAKDDLDKKVKEIEKQKKEAKKYGGYSSSSVGFTPSVSSKSSYGSTASGSYTISEEELNAMAGESYYEKPKERVPRPPPAKGLTLGKKSKARDKAQQMILEEGLSPSDRIRKNTTQDEPVVEEPIITKGLLLQFNEIVNIKMSRNGGVDEFSVKGNLTVQGPQGGKFALRVNQRQEKLKLRVAGGVSQNTFDGDKYLVFENRKQKDPSYLLQWMLSSKNDRDVPININCWGVTDTGKGSTFSLEVELKNENMNLGEIDIMIPVINPREVQVSDISGTIEAHERDNILKWTTSPISKDNPSASLEFSVPVRTPEDNFYPINVSFTSESNLGFVEIDNLVPVDENDEPLFDEQVEHEIRSRLNTKSFVVQ